jgi:large subunit ribosomal protein L25
VPGVIYGGGSDPVSIAVDERVLRNTLAAKGAVIDVAIDGGASEPVVLKDAQRHPVRGQIVHVDLLRVDLKQKIEAAVSVEVVDTEDGVGVKLGGIVEQMLREVTVEALPADIPESVQISVAELEIGNTLSVSDIAVPKGAVILDEPETVVVTLSPPRLASEVEAEEEAAQEAGALAAEGSEANESTVLEDDDASESDGSSDSDD